MDIWLTSLIVVGLIILFIVIPTILICNCNCNCMDNNKYTEI